MTAWNPEGVTATPAANEQTNARLLAQLTNAGHFHFPVTGGSEDFRHAEPGFGILATKDACMKLGQQFRQEAIFWIERGQVQLCSCTDDAHHVIGKWKDRATGAAAHPDFHFRGSASLLDSTATAFLCSTKCPGDQVLAAYAWARRQCDERSTVISGFHTPVEQDVLAILARRDANILWVPGRDLPQKLAAVLATALEEQRLLILTPFDYGKPSRPTRESCSQRNQFILRRTSNRFIAHAAPGSSLEADLKAITLTL